MHAGNGFDDFIAAFNSHGALNRRRRRDVARLGQPDWKFRLVHMLRAHQIRNQIAKTVNLYGKANVPRVRAGGRVYSNYLAIRVEQWPPGVSWIDRAVGLDDVC